MINCHTHIFNVKCAPDRFHGPPLARFLSKFPARARDLVKILRILWPFSSNDFLERYAKMLQVGAEKHQRDIFTSLLDQYAAYENPRMVAHTLDMDFMGAGEAVNDYCTQIKEVADAKSEFAGSLIAFFSVDPRRPGVTDLLEEYVLRRGFTGIKLYPALGFFPFDPRLVPVYEFALKYDLPILSHCDIGGIYYRGPLSAEHLTPRSMNAGAVARDYSKFAKIKRDRFKDFFSDPENYLEVLSTPGFSKLKICLAHYGGFEMISEKKDVSPTPNNWYKSIRGMLEHPDYPNVYTDISYTLCHTDKNTVNILGSDIRHPVIGNKILFGTDFYMTVRVKDEPRLVDDFITKYGITQADFMRLSITNNTHFLTTTFFRP